MASLVSWEYDPKNRIILWSDPINHGKLIEDLQKLLQSHQKNFAIRKKFVEIFIKRGTVNPEVVGSNPA